MKALVAALSGAALLVGCSAGTSGAPQSASSASSTKSTASSPAEQEVEQKGLVLQKGWKVQRSYGYAKVVGIVKNHGDAIETYAQVTFKSYDKKGNNLGDCLANTNSIDANGTWKFEAACLKTGVAKVKFKEVTGA
ncbi:FxLYD domain-containing protein [Micropruina sp.]|uniref:FxLYD domain-containing protein n=1 Tax=Micropruina sp. TaxID=2737536 RepID=UPI0039E41CD9